MNASRNRRLSAIVGAFLLLVAGGTAFLWEGVFEAPVLLGQVTMLGLAGCCDIVAATDTRLTDRWPWYRWSGLGNVLLGVALPLGAVGSDDTLVFAVVAGVGGLSLVAMGIDMLVFHGAYTRGQRLDRPDS